MGSKIYLEVVGVSEEVSQEEANEILNQMLSAMDSGDICRLLDVRTRLRERGLADVPIEGLFEMAGRDFETEVNTSKDLEKSTE